MHGTSSLPHDSAGPPDCPVKRRETRAVGQGSIRPRPPATCKTNNSLTYSYRLLHRPSHSCLSLRQLAAQQPAAISGRSPNSATTSIASRLSRLGSLGSVPHVNTRETSSASRSRTATSIRRFSISARWRPKIVTLAPSPRRNARHTECWRTCIGPSGETMVMHGASSGGQVMHRASPKRTSDERTGASV